MRDGYGKSNPLPLIIAGEGNARPIESSPLSGVEVSYVGIHTSLMVLPDEDQL